MPARSRSSPYCSNRGILHIVRSASLKPSDAEHSRRNVASLIVVSVLLGLSLAIYENALPFYLWDKAVSRPCMGLIYAVPALAVCVIRLGAGRWSDVVGRKLVYVLAFIANAGATLFTPLTASVVAQTALKSVRESALQVRQTIHSVLLYEGARGRFLALFGRTRGAEFLFHFAGCLLAAAAYSALSRRTALNPERVLLFAAAGLLAAGAVSFGGLYRETGFVPSREERVRLRDFVRPRLHYGLYVLMASIFVFNIGLSCSHSFAIQLFFLEKFHVRKETVFLIMAFHRLSIALPMFFIGRFARGDLKRLYIFFLVTEGALISVPGFISGFWPATIVWLFHDLFGAGVWLPIQHSLLQRYSRKESRGKEVSIVLSLSYLGMAAGPMLAGYLSGISWVAPGTAVSLPFIVGGAIIAAAAPVLLLLPKVDSAGEG